MHLLTIASDGSERQSIKDWDGNVPRPKIRYCSICDPFVLIIREDDSIGLFIGETERGKIRRKDMSPMGEKVCHICSDLLPSNLTYVWQTSKYLAGGFFTDTTGIFQTHVNTQAPGSENVTSTLQAAMNAGNKSQWLVLCRPQGVVEVTSRWSEGILHNSL